MTIKFINNVNGNIKGTSGDLIAALRYQRSFINAKKVGKLIISNEGNYKFDNPRWGGRFLGVTAPNAIVEVNGGSYGSYAVGTFYFNGCNATLTGVTVRPESYARYKMLEKSQRERIRMKAERAGKKTQE